LGQSVGLELLGTCLKATYFWFKFAEKDHSKGIGCAISSDESLRKKISRLAKPFTYSTKLFLSKFVFKEESDYLLLLYMRKK
jgi:hypothetical protein